MNNLYYKSFHDADLEKHCKLLIVTDKDKELLFTQLLNDFIKLPDIKTCGFDLEFNTPDKSTGERRIALIQIALYFKEIIIVFIDPEKLSKSTNELFINMLSNKSILKIGHGTDSLDIPALYKYINDKDKILSFTNSLYDTRFLCEYTNIFTENKYCNIYFSIEYFGVVKEKQIDFLAENEKKLGKFWLIYIDINKLPKALIEYAMYDALYLKQLAINIKTIIDDNGDNYNLILSVTRLVLLLRQQIYVIPTVSHYNMYMINKMSLISMFNNTFNTFYDNIEQSNKKIFAFGFFKKQLLPLLQVAFYVIVCNQNKVYSNNNTLMTDKELSHLNKSWKKVQNIVKNYNSINKIIQIFITFI
jgi:hypothetical protein